MIENIVFDMGGVLIDYDPTHTLRKVFSEQDAVLAEQVLFQSGLWNDLDLGVKRFPEIAAAACEKLPARMHAPLTALLGRWWAEEMPPFPRMVPFIRQLKENGYKVYLCSNTSADIYDYFDAIPALALMDGILASCDVGVIKPDARLYEALYRKFDLSPETCFFIDDMPRNIEGAARTGMTGHCFADKDLDRLKDALREKGVRI